jgi:hypothetical protein
MRLRVLDDDRPGYAQLAFDAALTPATLAVSVRSQHAGAFLGPDGAWQRTAHFFTAVRIGGDTQSALYRVGPDIVNYLLNLDTVEFAAGDGSFSLETTWENAIPQMADRQKGLSIYREGAAPHDVVLTRTTSAREPEPPVSPPEPPESAPSPPPVSSLPPPPVIAPVPPPPPIAASADATHGEKPGEPTEDVDHAPSRGGFAEGLTRRRVYWLSALGVLGLAVLVFALFLVWPCGWLGAGQCVAAGDLAAAQKARACAASKTQAGQDCDVAQECIAPYLASFPNGQARPELEKIATTSDAICQKRHQDGKAEEGVLRVARQCAADPAKKCALPGCYAAYLHTYGLAGAFKNEAQREAVTLDQTCLDEDAVLQSARDCAADASKKCAQPGCFAEYLSTYGFTGVHKNEARSEASALSAKCARETQDHSPAESELPVAVGDTYEKVRRVYGNVKAPSEYCESNTGTGAPCPKKQLRFEDRGLWFFFDAQGKIYTIRLDAPWPGRISGIKIGDSKATVERQLGVPNGRDGPQEGTGPYYYNGSYIYRRAGKFIAVFTFDSSSNRVQTIFIT